MGQTTTRRAAGTALADHVTTLAEQTFATADGLRAAAEELFSGVPENALDLAALRPLVSAALGGLITGAGVITTPLADGIGALEWWMVTGPGERSRLDLDLDPASENFVDVARQAWFSAPRDTGRRHVTGPYVDYVCAEQYTLTFTVPLTRRGAFAGIAGADVFVGDFERALRPVLRGAGGPVALVNMQGRIVAGSTAHHITGSLIREPHIRAALADGVARTLTDGVTLVPCPNLPLAVLTWPTG
ncbi:cache domain-containing protein [Actinoplanes sp. NPDC051861]|uniref:cache domain-containing protein n=1 Tax=Actinoplanes sp. NPDC051861 TaxID=3155170 RepID=UPI00343C034D